MKEYIIYSKIIDKEGNEYTLYAAHNDDAGAKFIKKEDEGFYKIVKFPTLNSAIIWWRGHMEWIYNDYGFYASILNYNPYPIIEVAETKNNDISGITDVHTLSLYDTDLNEPDKSTWTDEERRDYERYVEKEYLVRNAIKAITSRVNKPITKYDDELTNKPVKTG